MAKKVQRRLKPTPFLKVNTDIQHMNILIIMHTILTGRYKKVLDFTCVLDRTLQHIPGWPGNDSIPVQPPT